ncbi:TonB C-terminal domain-containing protein [Desulfobacterium sp. N47]|uniref:TonB C-terminal domain-containing protein n=1 Tax=Desulfobacterium sp. N47 TaxID=3115210 RepID=UPI003F49EFC4
MLTGTEAPAAISVAAYQSSGKEILDKSVMEAVKIASPFSRPPAKVKLRAESTGNLQPVNKN